MGLKQNPNFHSHCFKGVTQVGFFWNSKMVLATSIHRRLNSHVRHKIVLTKHKLWQSWNQKKELAFYILFHGSRILRPTLHPSSSEHQHNYSNLSLRVKDQFPHLTCAWPHNQVGNTTFTVRVVCGVPGNLLKNKVCAPWTLAPNYPLFLRSTRAWRAAGV